MFNAIKTALNDHHDHQLHDVQAPPAVSSSTAYAGEPVPQPQVEASPAAPTCAAEPPPIPQPTRSVAAQSLDLPLAHLAQLGAGCGSWNICKVGHGISSAACNARVESCGGEEVFTVVYPKDSFKPQGPIVGGIGFYSAPCCLPADHAIFSYQLKPAENFDWVKGGKLPGLYFGEPGASGGRHAEDKASCRIMWRPEGVAEAYVYLPLGAAQSPEYDLLPGLKRNAKFGDSVWRGLFHLHKNEWNTVSIEVTTNTFGTAGPNQDGLLSVKINDAQMRFEKLVWRTDAAVRVGGITFDTFFGGNDDSYRTPVDTFIQFKGFRVDVPGCNVC